jgi:hypothetical protein
MFKQLNERWNGDYQRRMKVLFVFISDVHKDVTVTYGAQLGFQL